VAVLPRPAPRCVRPDRCRLIKNETSLEFPALILAVCFLVVAHNSQTLPAIQRELARRLDNISKFGTYSGNFDD
jgi:hypothetical protein